MPETATTELSSKRRRRFPHRTAERRCGTPAPPPPPTFTCRPCRRVSGIPSRRWTARCAGRRKRQRRRSSCVRQVCYPTCRSPDSGLLELIAMNTTAKIQHKGQVTIPTSVRRQAGLSQGDLVNFAFQRGKIVITPRLVIDRAQFPNADDEYTPAQRRIIDAGLDKAEKGPSYGPFNTADEMIAHMKGELKKRAAAKKSKRVEIGRASCR